MEIDMITDEQQESRRTYRKVVNTVYHNTTPKQPPMIEATTVRLICSYSSIDASTVDSKLRMAVKNDDLITDGTRFCVTDDKARLQRAAQAVAKQVPVNQDLLGKINTAKMNL